LNIKIRRSANALWRGTVEGGCRNVALGSGAFSGPYSLRSHVGDAAHTNAEELVDAAHAGCFAMSLANLVAQAGYTVTEISASSPVSLEQVDGRFTSTGIALSAIGDVPGLDKPEFARLADEANETCPVSRTLAGVEITLDARLGAAA
jgi:osmotically inducible protein OsmC